MRFWGVGFLALVLAATGVAAAGPRERPPPIVVGDATTAEWDGMVREAVRDMNAAMPATGPRLVYKRLPAGDCRPAADITICSKVLNEQGTYGKARWLFKGKGRITLNNAYAYPDRDEADMETTVCHELMHVLTGIRRHEDEPDASCVWGNLSDPGPVDVKLLRKKWG